MSQTVSVAVKLKPSSLDFLNIINFKCFFLEFHEFVPSLLSVLSVLLSSSCFKNCVLLKDFNDFHRGRFFLPNLDCCPHFIYAFLQFFKLVIKLKLVHLVELELDPRFPRLCLVIREACSLIAKQWYWLLGVFPYHFSLT